MARNHGRNDQDHGHEAMRRAVRMSQERAKRWRREGERSIGQNLAMIGSLGWLIALPTVAGAFIGRWLDGRFDSGITLTAALVFLGAAAGFWLAWRRMHQE